MAFFIVASAFGGIDRPINTKQKASGFIVSRQTYPQEQTWIINSKILIAAPEGNSIESITLEFLHYQMAVTSKASIKLTNVADQSSGTARNVTFQHGKLGIFPVKNHVYRFFRKSRFGLPLELIYNNTGVDPRDHFMFSYHGEFGVYFLYDFQILWVCCLFPGLNMFHT